MILDILDHYKGAFTYRELWEETSGREITEIHERASEQAHEAQRTTAMQALVLLTNPFIGGMKHVNLDDLFTGLARHSVDKPPFPPQVLRGIRLANRLGGGGRLVLSQAHLDLLDGRAVLKWLERD